MRISQFRFIILVLAYLAISFATYTINPSAEGSTEVTPPWKNEFVLWPRHQGEEAPWRGDARMSPLAPEGYPDDFPVRFYNPDPEIADEIIWVTAIGYFKATDQYLGIVLNEPFNLTTIKERDNVIFEYDAEAKELNALSSNSSYTRRAIPDRARSSELSSLWEGIRQYRLGNFGHNQEAIQECIAILSSASSQLGAFASTNDHYVAHYILGRCNAEAYNTDAAIMSFGNALKYNSNNLHAHMALLAEYSLKVQADADPSTGDDESIWEELFIAKLNYVREHFLDDGAVAVITKILFDESEVTNLSAFSEEELARKRKYGFATFRWKRP